MVHEKLKTMIVSSEIKSFNRLDWRSGSVSLAIPRLLLVWPDILHIKCTIMVFSIHL